MRVFCILNFLKFYYYRFGVSLKKREPSTESCSSLKEDCKEKSPQRTSLSLTSPSHDGKSPMSIDSDVPAVGSPLEPLPPPPCLPESGKTDCVFFYCFWLAQKNCNKLDNIFSL